MKNIAEKNGTKIAATAIIWGFTTGIMAISIPLVSISRSGIILPITVIFGASKSTTTIWRSSNQKASELSNNFQQIEQRLRDLETICSGEQLDITNKFKQLDS